VTVVLTTLEPSVGDIMRMSISVTSHCCAHTDRMTESSERLISAVHYVPLAEIKNAIFKKS